MGPAGQGQAALSAPQEKDGASKDTPGPKALRCLSMLKEKKNFPLAPARGWPQAK